MVIAQYGYDIEQNPKFPGTQNPDYRIEGKIFDNFSPELGTPVRNIFDVVSRKVKKGQARRVSINLHDSNVTLHQLKEQFEAWSIENLEEVIAITDGKVHQIFPKSNG